MRPSGLARGTVLRVSVVSPFPLVRTGVHSLLEREGLTIECGDDGAARPDVVVLDLVSLDRDDGAGLEHTRWAGTPVVGLVPFGRDDLARKARERNVGAVVPISATSSDLLRAIIRVLAASEAQAPEPPADRPATLTAREEQMVRMIAAGHTNAEIAAELYLSTTTVKSYIRSAYRKLGITRRAEAVRWAIDHGVVDRPLPPST